MKWPFGSLCQILFPVQIFSFGKETNSARLIKQSLVKSVATHKANISCGKFVWRSKSRSFV